MNTYQYLKDYLPVRYQANAQQLADRQTCYNFKDGYLNDEVKSGFLNKIQKITNGEKTGWDICFIPASTKSKTQARYKKLAEAEKQLTEGKVLDGETSLSSLRKKYNV